MAGCSTAPVPVGYRQGTLPYFATKNVAKPWFRGATGGFNGLGAARGGRGQLELALFTEIPAVRFVAYFSAECVRRSACYEPRAADAVGTRW